MSTNKSQNLNLHLWTPEDDFLRTEFNENFAAIDTAVKADRTAIATVQQTANSALSKANAAYSPNQKPYVTGSYTGTGTDMTINLGFRPSFVIISALAESISNSNAYNVMAFLALSGGNALPMRFTFSDTGFTLLDTASSSYKFPNLTMENRVYDYIAFR